MTSPCQDGIIENDFNSFYYKTSLADLKFRTSQTNFQKDHRQTLLRTVSELKQNN